MQIFKELFVIIIDIKLLCSQIVVVFMSNYFFVGYLNNKKRKTLKQPPEILPVFGKVSFHSQLLSHFDIGCAIVDKQRFGRNHP